MATHELVLAPLDDPRYQPKHPPVNGLIPDVVAKWGPRSQVRWFGRYTGQLRAQPHAAWDQYNVHSLRHRGLCCGSCLDEQYNGFDSWSDNRCCCRAEEETRTDGS